MNILLSHFIMSSNSEEDGDSEHGGATSSSKSFRIDPKPFIETHLGIITIGVGITVATVAAIILVHRKRRA